MKHQDFVAAVKSYVGTPFAHQGRCPGKGLDCVGVLVCAAHESGLSKADFLRYSEEPDGTLLKNLEPHLKRVEDGSMLVGDTLVIRYASEPTHIMVIVGFDPKGRPRVVHSLNRDGVVSHHLDALWMRRIVAVYRFEEGD